LVALVADYLENAHPSDQPPWDLEYEEIVQAAIGYANSKRFRLRRFKTMLNRCHQESLQQETAALRRTLKDGRSSEKAHKGMVEQLRQLERLLTAKARYPH
jgi:hypothetical protein